MPTQPESDLAYLINHPPEEALRYLSGKDRRVSWSWRDLSGPEHGKSFTVAKAMGLDLLTDIHQALNSARQEGRTERMFAKDLTPILQAKGWWGEKWVAHPDGGEQLVELGSPLRLETIFRTNMQTAYMAGRYKQMLENAQSRPYWMYVAVMDSRTRKSHATLNGRIFRYDDPVWAHIYPPNGFRCRCRVRALSESAMQRGGYELEKSSDYMVQLDQGEDPLAPSIALRLPGGRFAPDTGWDYNPGAAWSRWDKNGLLPDCLGGVAYAESDGKNCIQSLPGQKSWQEYGRSDLRDVGNDLRLPSPSLLKVGKDANEALQILQTALGVSKENPVRVVRTPVDLVIIRAEYLPHVVAKREHRREVTANYIVPTLESPYEIWLTEYADGFRKRYIGLFQDQRDLLSVVRESQDGSLLWNVIRMRDVELNRQRTGSLMWKK
ncbi:phage minor head protein [Candidatus Magnetaquicoccus inordinatus]|uniref:phage minor head protein n=1 Tax=Candidatus Magnetaquicoccus inordinatus TaxID=2496818 RepID=UPI00102C1369|nr:phage minor head protein [Candidatus Magnetaquicoccus inordinatus]